MKDRVRRLAQAAATFGRTGLTRRGLWARWFAPARAVDPEAFQDPTEPFPRHWRAAPAELAGLAGIDGAWAELPVLWQQVLEGRFRDGDDPGEVAARLGLTEAAERRISNRALAQLRRRLVER